jgi:peptidoglycan/LPS O-acetylase OafA/YrhL
MKPRTADRPWVTPPAYEERRPAFRPELQVLRAFAVVSVVVYHFWPSRLPGGFVGVDMFFVVSGFLITGQLLAEARSGRIALGGFWARRVRRLLPASLLVLAVCYVGVQTIVPAAYRVLFLREIIASALYFQNWNLAAQSVDYLAAGAVASPVQHYWSLSVEEQFYVIWPVLIALVLLAVRRASGITRMRALLIVLAAVTLGSLALSIVDTQSIPAPAYFITPTRMWEFGAGGLLAFVGSTRSAGAARAVLGWVGWALAVVSVCVITGTTPFPGWAAALPVAAVLAVVAAGHPGPRWSSGRVLTRRPAVFIGDISYSIYLWHWPALVFLGFCQPGPLSSLTKIVAIAAVVCVAAITTRFVENPARSWRPARNGTAVTLAAAVLAMAIVVVPAGVAWSVTRTAQLQQVQAAQARADRHASCFGAEARVPGHDCPPSAGPLTPEPAAAVDDVAREYGNGCIQTEARSTLKICHFGSATGHLRVALIGDSHAVAWSPAIRALEQQRNWAVTEYLKSACPFSTASSANPVPGVEASCTAWNASVAAELAVEAPYDLVFITHSSANDAFVDDATAIAGFRAAFREITDHGSPVVVIRDTPLAAADTLVCLDAHGTDPDACARLSDDPQVLGDDLMAQAAIGVPGVSVIDMNDLFCWSGTCKEAIGGVTVYRDTHHLTATFAKTLAPELGRRLDALRPSATGTQ